MGKNPKDKSFLLFIELPQTGKTKIFEVVNKSNFELGIIKWQSGWRRYVLNINDSVLFDSACLKEVIQFLDELMNERAK